MTKKFSITALAVSSLLAMGSAQATVTDLGPASPGSPLSFGALAAQGPFNDIFTFSLPANGGSGYSVTNFTLLPGGFNTMLATLSLISNPDGILYNADDMTLASSVVPGGGSLALVFPSSPAGFYYLNVTGIANGQLGGIYNGAISVAVVPEPETYALMLGGLGLIGFMAARRRRQD
jgi:hypothetical protein